MKKNIIFLFAFTVLLITGSHIQAQKTPETDSLKKAVLIEQNRKFKYQKILKEYKAGISQYQDNLNIQREFQELKITAENNIKLIEKRIQLLEKEIKETIEKLIPSGSSIQEKRLNPITIKWRGNE